MTDGSRHLADAELESVLRDVASHLVYPATADLVPAVKERTARHVRPSLWRELWSPRFALIPAVVTVFLLALATVAFQPAGARAIDGLRGLVIFRTAATPTPAPSATASPRGVLSDAHRVASVEAASREAGFTVLVPSALGPPDEVYVSSTPQVVQAFLVYASRPGIPASAQTGIGVLVTEAKGSFDFALLGKLAGPGTKTEQLAVDGRPAIWIEGLHQFFYRTPGGAFVNDTVRLSGNVLVWNRDDLLVRVEADLPRDEVVRIASSLR